MTESYVEYQIMELRERLLREDNLTLMKAVDMCRATETTKSKAKELIGY